MSNNIPLPVLIIIIILTAIWLATLIIGWITIGFRGSLNAIIVTAVLLWLTYYCGEHLKQ